MMNKLVYVLLGLLIIVCVLMSTNVNVTNLENMSSSDVKLCPNSVKNCIDECSKVNPHTELTV